MNRIKKRITVRFFSIKANDSFFDEFISISNSNQANEKTVRIINIREKKHLIKIHATFKHQKKSVFFLSVVRERNTWQTRALRNGTISGIPLNQGIIGDPYYFLTVPKDKIILGFTTGLSGSLKSVANTILQQFNKDRVSKVALEHISKKKEFSKLKELSEYKLHFKVNATSLGELDEDTPGILRELGANPFMAYNSQVALTLDDTGLPEIELVDIVNYLSENDGCYALTVHGIDNKGEKVHLDFSRAFAIFKTEIEIRNKFVDESKARETLLNALGSLDLSKIADS